MPDYDIGKVNEFTAKLQIISPDVLVMVWTKMCGYDKKRLLGERYQRLVDDFFELSPWDQQGALHQAVPLVTNVARLAANKSSQEARIKDPM